MKTALVKTIEILNLDELKKATTEDLRSRLTESLRFTADKLLYMAAIVGELERRGDDLMSLRLGMVRWLRAIGSGQLLPEIVVRYAGRQKLLELISALPVSVQKSLVDDPTVVVMASNVPKRIDLLDIPYRTIDQVFADGRIRDEDEQLIYISGKQDQPKRKRNRSTEKIDLRTPHADAEHGGLRIGKSFVPKAAIVIEMARLAGQLVDIDPRDNTHETATVRLTTEEKQRLRATEKSSGLSEWQLIRHALRAYGLI